MRIRSKLGIVILLLLSVTAIFISPAVDLQPTALRAMQLANMLFAVLVLFGTSVSTLRVAPLSILEAALECAGFSPPASDLIDLHCSRLC